MFILSMVFYGVAFDFFNIAGSMFVDRNTDCRTRSCGQGLFMMMTNGFGASIGMLTVQYVVNLYTDSVAFGNVSILWEIENSMAVVRVFCIGFGVVILFDL